jgi:hypothetical protein
LLEDSDFERPIHIKRALNLGRLEAPVSILMEDEMAKCQIRGIAPYPEDR